MITKVLDCDIALNVVLGLISDQDVDAEAQFAAKGLPSNAKNTCLASLIARPTKTSLQYFARTLAYCEILKHGNKMLKTAYTSLSHTHGAVAVVWGSPANCNAVGMDIESKKRHISPELEKYFLVEGDLKTGLDRLSIWCLKEAAFKCLDDFQHSLLLRDIEIKPFSDGRFICQTTDCFCTAQLLDSGTDYFVAVAWR